MAGESPGKSEQRKSSGETTGGEHDPRLGVFRETSGKPSGKADAPESADAADAAEGGREEVSPAPGEADADAKGESSAEAPAKAKPSGSPSAKPSGKGSPAAGGDARLKAAVAAWVAGTDEEEAGEGSEAPEAASEAPAESASGEGAKASPGERVPADRATAVFRTVRPKAGAESASGEGEDGSAADRAAAGDGTASKASAAKGEDSAPADQATAVFRTARPKTGASSGDGDGDGKAADAAKAASGEGKDAEDAAADRATAFFGTVRPKAGASSRDGDGKAAEAAKSASGEGKGSDSPAADQATAVFRTVRPKADGTSADAAKAPSGKGTPSANGKAPVADDQPTALIKAPVADDQPTALIKAPVVQEPARKDGAAKDGPSKDTAAKDGASKKDGAAGPADSDSERTSQFVPLKSLDGAAKAAAPAKSAAPAKPAVPVKDAAKAPAKAPVPAPAKAPAKGGASAKGGAPAKPAIPVSVTPPAPSERTQQQPFPPKPDGGGPTVPPAAGQPAAPLDLLAQLTNTPPPPETPVRTVLRRVKIWTPLVVLLAIVFCVVQAFRPLPEPKLVLTAHKTFRFDGDKAQMTWPSSGQAYVEVDGLGALGEAGEEKPVPIASVTKVMTAYITLRDHPMKKGDKKGALMTVDAKAVSDYQKGKPEGESLVRVTENQKLSEYEALEALMLPSANNIAKLLARWDAGSEEAFVKKMNDTAKELGMVNTTFTDPSGFDATTKSTAKDLVKLGKKAMADPVFKEISGLTEYIDSNGEKQKNFNPIVPLYGTGIKTGTTTAAGGNLLFAAEKKIGGTTQLIVGAVLAQHKTPIIDSVVAATKDAIESAKKALEAKTVVKKGDVVGAVDDGLGGRTPVVATKDVTAVGWAGLTVGLELGDGGHKLPHAAKSGAEVGMLTVGSGQGQVRVPVALKAPLAEPGFGAKLTRLG
ncbi:D-alanyl-D-alanine carboxypeptidase family protein [Streptomyces hiroshimensis]|uniref:D-alanyl-D-alanine carboxypeptidase n=1 Tax=Streptomyces hiroshimensis TaxID=66424 RepID=A0ABQ2YAR7_9ACTN|nr:D-alanyl-D-alanine carboxypeptidase [Streptomyces hiroshimensis]GGX78230.1 D-alanyl-D-alanine carboxypeptidase [Streptomyces hiroshimensis]